MCTIVVFCHFSVVLTKMFSIYATALSPVASMLAVRAGAKSVYACEMSKTMFEVATDIVAMNGMSTNIRLIHKNSKELTIPEDIPNRSVHDVDVCICLN